MLPSRGTRSGPRTTCSSTDGPLSNRFYEPPAEIAGDDLAVEENGVAAHDRALDDAAKRAAHVGAELVTVEEHVAGEFIVFPQVHKRQVGIVLLGDGAFPLNLKSL